MTVPPLPVAAVPLSRIEAAIESVVRTYDITFFTLAVRGKPAFLSGGVEPTRDWSAIAAAVQIACKVMWQAERANRFTMEFFAEYEDHRPRFQIELFKEEA
jgi:hypothetical protein